MRASEFARQRARINRRARGRQAFASKALEHLARDADATPLRTHGRIVAWALPNGGVVCVKERLRDGHQAFAELERIALQTPKGDHIPIRAYRCTFCGGWHLTSQNARNY